MKDILEQMMLIHYNSTHVTLTSLISLDPVDTKHYKPNFHVIKWNPWDIFMHFVWQISFSLLVSLPQSIVDDMLCILAFKWNFRAQNITTFCSMLTAINVRHLWRVYSEHIMRGNNWFLLLHINSLTFSKLFNQDCIFFLFTVIFFHS